MIIVRRLIRLLEKTQGRDKLTKTLIYILKLIDVYRSWRISAPSYRYERISIHFQHARQLMRLGKTFFEIQLIHKTLNMHTKDEFNRMISVICYAAYGIYWLLDNITIINEYNFINLHTHLIRQYAMTAKFIGLFFALLLNIRNFMRFHYEEIKTRQKLKTLKDKQNLEADIHITNLINQEHREFYMLLKTAGDMLPTIAKSVFAKRIFKFQVPRLAQNLGGLVSAISACILVDW